MNSSFKDTVYRFNMGAHFLDPLILGVVPVAVHEVHEVHGGGHTLALAS